MEIIVLVKRTIFLRIFSIGLLLIYLTLIVLSTFGLIVFHQFWFSAFLVYSGIVMILRYFCFKAESTLFCGILLFFFGTSGVFSFLILISLALKFSLYVCSLALAEITIFLKFRQIFHLKVFSFELLCVILLVLYDFKLLPTPAFVVLISVTGFVVLGMMGLAVKINTRKV